jgi:CheY-like chemotaxis protein
MSSSSIFIVEDELIEAEDIRQTLEKLGYTVMGIARSGEAALNALTRCRPDLILMDIHLAGNLDGIETAGQIRDLYPIPVVFLTAHVDEITLSRAQITEPYGYVLKPFDDRELRTSIEMALYKHRMEELVRKNERTIRILANAIPDAVVLLDRDQSVLALNDAMAHRLARGNTAACTVSYPGFDQSGMFTSLESQVKESLRIARPIRFEERCGDEWFEIAIFPLLHQDPAETRVLVQYHNITDHKKFEDELKHEGISRIEQNMEQFQILNDQIRNPLQAILGFVNLDCVGNRDRIMDQIQIINSLVARLDRGWVESEKVRRFLIRHYRSGTIDAPAPAGDEPEAGGP